MVGSWGAQGGEINDGAPAGYIPAGREFSNMATPRECRSTTDSMTDTHRDVDFTSVHKISFALSVLSFLASFSFSPS